MILHPFRAAALAAGLLAVAALAAGQPDGRPDAPRPVPAPPRVAAQPPAPKAKAEPAEIVVGRVGAYWRLAPDGKKLGEYAPPDRLRFNGGPAVSPDGKWVAVAASEPVVVPPAPEGSFPRLKYALVVSPLAGGAAKVFDRPIFALGLHWLPDGKSLLVEEPTDWQVTSYDHLLLDPVTGKTRPLAVPASCRVLDVSRDGTSFLTEIRGPKGQGAKLGLVPGEGAAVAPLLDLTSPSRVTAARFSPDGTKVLFVDADPARKDAHKWGRSHRPYVLDVATRKREALAGFPENGQAVGVCWSPDGTRVAYTWVQLHPDILTMDALSGDDVNRETGGFVVVADADGRNARTVATDKSPVSVGLVFGQLDWR